MATTAHPQFSGEPMVILGNRAMLSPRESEMVALEADGLRDIEKAAVAGIKISTVLTHIESAKNKLGAWTRSQMISRAFQLKILILVTYDKAGEIKIQCSGLATAAAVLMSLGTSTFYRPDLIPDPLPDNELTRPVRSRSGGRGRGRVRRGRAGRNDLIVDIDSLQDYLADQNNIFELLEVA